MKKQKNRIKVMLVSMSIILTFLVTGCSKSSKTVYNEAVSAYNKGDYQTAATNFEKAIKMKDDDADYYIDYGFCLIALGDYEKAEQNFKRAILDKNNVIVKRNNKKAYRGLGIMYYKQGNYDSAIQNLEKAFEYDSLKDYNMDIVSYIGSAYLAIGNYEKALESFQTILEKDSNNTSARKSRAMVYLQLEKYEESIADFTQVLEKSKKDYDAYIGLYQAYLASGDTVNADATLEKATRLEVKDENDKFQLAKIFYYQQNYDQAIEIMQEVSKEGIIESYLYLGDIYMQKGDNTSAMDSYEQYLELNQGVNVLLYNKLSTCYLNTNHPKKALKLVKKALELASGSTKQNLLRNEIICYEQLGDYERALKKMLSYISAYPEDEEAAKDLEFLKTRQVTEDSGDEGSESEPVIEKP